MQTRFRYFVSYVPSVFLRSQSLAVILTSVVAVASVVVAVLLVAALVTAAAFVATRVAADVDIRATAFFVTVQVAAALVEVVSVAIVVVVASLRGRPAQRRDA